MNPLPHSSSTLSALLVFMHPILLCLKHSSAQSCVVSFLLMHIHLNVILLWASVEHGQVLVYRLGLQKPSLLLLHPI